MNPVVRLLHRIGLGAGPTSVVTVRGRRSRKLRSTPVTTFQVEGRRYVLGGFVMSDWVRNARAYPQASLTSRRRTERVFLCDLPLEERRFVLEHFPALVPRGVSMLVKAGVVAGSSPADFVAAAPRLAVFRIDPI